MRIIMKVIQISDLHIDETNDETKTRKKIDLMCQTIKDNVSKMEQLVFCFLGDLINKGIPQNFDRLSPILEYICDAFRDYAFSFEFVPGNHDLCLESDGSLSTSKFNDYIKKYVDYNFTPTDTVHIKEYDGMTLVLLSSVCHFDHKFGSISIEQLKNKIEHYKKPYLVMTHHALLGDNEKDISPIRNSNALATLMKSNYFIGFLHGHTHGYKNIKVENCQIIGVGPFLKDVPNINNQFNFIDIHSGQIFQVDNFFYREDFEEYNCMTVYKNNCNYYLAKSVNELYCRVTNDLSYKKYTFNLCMQLESSLCALKKDIETYCGDHIKNAQELISSVPPENMKYNHGQYWNLDAEVSGIDYVVNRLKVSPNSTRAILPLINMNEVIKTSGQDKKEDLPALNVIQFSLDNTTSTLNVSMYFRSLEVNNFLKTNICEAFLCAQKISEEIPFIKFINLSIFAAIAQYYEGYKSGNKVSAIDNMSSEKLTYYLSKHAFHKIAQLLEEKKNIRNYSDTTAIENMSKALVVVSDMHTLPGGVLAAFTETKSLIDEYNNLKTSKAMFSALKELENKIDQAMSKLIEQFRGI